MRRSHQMICLVKYYYRIGKMFLHFFGYSIWQSYMKSSKNRYNSNVSHISVQPFNFNCPGTIKTFNIINMILCVRVSSFLYIQQHELRLHRKMTWMNGIQIVELLCSSQNAKQTISLFTNKKSKETKNSQAEN